MKLHTQNEYHQKGDSNRAHTIFFLLICADRNHHHRTNALLRTATKYANLLEQTGERFYSHLHTRNMCLCARDETSDLLDSVVERLFDCAEPV